jgi:hypothetical protein
MNQLIQLKPVNRCDASPGSRYIYGFRKLHKFHAGSIRTSQKERHLKPDSRRSTPLGLSNILAFAHRFSFHPGSSWYVRTSTELSRCNATRSCRRVSVIDCKESTYLSARKGRRGARTERLQVRRVGFLICANGALLPLTPPGTFARMSLDPEGKYFPLPCMYPRCQ